MNKKISVQNISKSFNLDAKHKESMLSRLIGFLPRSDKDSAGEAAKRQKEKIRKEVLRNISFEVAPGEILGVIGRNGTGKSTLLRVIAGIYKADTGAIETDGKLVYIAGFGQGLQPKLTMRENIFLMSSIRGLSQKAIREKFDDIVEFSGLADHVDVRLYQFSNGMVSRLNFSIILHCVEHQNPDILLLDEVLSGGGDIDFREKANKRMEDLVRGGASVVMVSHELDALSKYCHRLMLISQNGDVEFGDPETILKKYKNEGK